ncbi:4-hydroxy-tetrahydrodipicolinate synthase [Gemmatimonas sp.]|uniref:4-hydroxy-tetrahydrodipicolinate synthase n=1 Tax=Gemmatimonas sp. TaxID=1962908 RepID=UPI003F71EFB3
MTTTQLRGCGTALVTPFLADGSVDEPALRALVQWQLAAGIHMLIPCGSTGEAVTLTTAEHRRVVEITVEEVSGRVPVIAGAGCNDTHRAIATSREMRAIGATHLLHVTPMYNKPPQRALLAHFRAIADACDLPIVLYNVPGRTAVNMDAATTLELARDPRFVAVKEASGNLAQMTTIVRDRPADFSVLSGDDGFTLALMAHGGDGIISVVSNVAPSLMVRLCEAMLRRDLAEARALDAALAPLIDACFVESNPIPAKAMLAMMGRLQDRVRLPLVPLAESWQARVRGVLEHAGLLAS